MNRRHTSFASRVALVSVVAMIGLLAGTIRPASAGLIGGPTLTKITPNVVYPGVANQKVTLTGTFNDQAGQVSVAPNTGITVGAVTRKTATTFEVNLTVAETAPTATLRDVTITQDGLLDGGTATCAKCLRVGHDVTAAGPPVANNGNNASFTVTGHAFKTGATVRLERKSYGFNATENEAVNISQGVTVTPGTAQNGMVSSLTASFNPLGRPPGFWKVIVTNADNTQASLGDGVTSGLQITGSKPTLQTISPPRINNNQSSAQFTLTGKGFARGMTATVSGSGVTQSAAIDVQSLTSAILRLTSGANIGTGSRTLTLKNADGQQSVNADAIWANQDPASLGPPTISTVTPALLGQGASQVQMIVTGTNFAGPVPTVTVSPNDTDATKKIDIGVTRDSATQLTLTVSVGAATPTGARSLTVTNPDNTTITKANAFEISDDVVVTSVAPPGRPRGYTGSFVINGSGFDKGTASVAINPANDITLGTPVVNSAAKITVPVTVGNNAALDPRDVLVTIAGSPQKTCSGCFTVGVLPTVTSISPNSGNGGAQVSISAIAGTNFKNPTATLEREGQTPITLTGGTATATAITGGTFDLTDAAPGKWSLKVTNLDGGSASLADAFTVVLPSPTVTAATPETISQATPDVTLTITGTAFAPGMTVSFPNAGGITVNDVTRKSGTSAEVKISTADNATLGSRDVKVTNADGKSGTCTSCFVIVQGTQAKNFGPGITAFENFNGGAFVAAGSLDGVASNGTEFVVGANYGGGPHVKPYRINPANGNVQELGSGFFAYGDNFPGGVRVAIGDIDGNPANGQEIVTGAGPGGGPHVRVFHLNNDLTVNEPFGNGFFAYTPNFSGGVYVATGDVNGDGKDDIITGAGPGGGPHVRAWTLAANGHDWTELFGFFAYDAAFNGGVAVAAGNIIPEAQDAAAKDEIVTVPSYGGGPHVKIYSGITTVKQFFAFDTGDPMGYRATSGDFNFDTIDDVAIGRASSSELFVAQITGAGPIKLVEPNPTPFGNLPTGTNLAAADVDGDGDDDLVLSPDHSSPVQVRLVRPLSLT